MSAKPIREFDGKLLLAHGLTMESLVANLSFDMTLLENAGEFEKNCQAVFRAAEVKFPWLLTTKLVCKPDQLIKRRGKNGLLGINLSWPDAKDWIRKKAGLEIKVLYFCSYYYNKIEKTQGLLHTFIVEPFVMHPQDTEYYVCIQAEREGDYILFTHEGVSYCITFN